MQSKWYIILVLAAALVGMVSGAGLAANKSSGCVGCDSSSANVTENKTVTHIFIQEGAGGSYVNDGSGNYTLTMTEVVPYTVGFADRPSRDVGFAPTDMFLKGFDFGASNPPNAAIILPEENDTSDMVVVLLTKPQYNNTTKTLTYKARQLKEYLFRSGWLQDHISEVDPNIPEKFGRVVLVIDGCPCIYVGSQCATTCRNACWKWKQFSCIPCGGCCVTNPNWGLCGQSETRRKTPEHPIKPPKTP